MIKVSYIWQVLALFFIGALFGMFITIKFLVPPSTVIEIGKIKLKGNNNQVKDILDLELIPGNEGKLIFKETPRQKRQLKRQARRNKKTI